MPLPQNVGVRQKKTQRREYDCSNVASNNPRVAFVISLGGGAVDGYSLLLEKTASQVT